MSLTTSRTRIATSLKELNVHWADVRQRWRDGVAQEFEKEYIDPLEGRVRAAVAAMEQMHEMLLRARKDCE